MKQLYEEAEKLFSSMVERISVCVEEHENVVKALTEFISAIDAERKSSVIASHKHEYAVICETYNTLKQYYEKRLTQMRTDASSVEMSLEYLRDVMAKTQLEMTGWPKPTGGAKN